jgi:hypothetical protein
VSYRAEFEGDALVELDGLPKDAFDALVERVLSWSMSRGTRP